MFILSRGIFCQSVCNVQLLRCIGELVIFPAFAAALVWCRSGRRGGCFLPQVPVKNVCGALALLLMRLASSGRPATVVRERRVVEIVLSGLLFLPMACVLWGLQIKVWHSIQRVVRLAAVLVRGEATDPLLYPFRLSSWHRWRT